MYVETKFGEEIIEGAEKDLLKRAGTKGSEKGTLSHGAGGSYCQLKRREGGFLKKEGGRRGDRGNIWWSPWTKEGGKV